MRKLSQFEKLGLVAAVIVACMFFYMKRVYEPQEKVLKKTVGKLNGVVREFNAIAAVPPVHTLKMRIKKQKEDLKDRESKLAGMMVQTGADREVTELLNTIVTILREKGMRVNTLTPAKEKRKEDLYDWNVYEVDMNGNFHGFTELLQRFRDLEDPVKIQKVTMGKGTGPNLNICLEILI